MGLEIGRIAQPVTALGVTYTTPLTTIPGIGAGAFAANDAFGTGGVISVPRSGIIDTAILYDFDDEGSQIDILLFNREPAQEVSDAAISISDADLANLVDVLEFATFVDLINNRVSISRGRGVAYSAPVGRLWFQAVTRATPTIAAGKSPGFRLIILSDERMEGQDA